MSADRASKVPAHRFDEDPSLPPDWSGNRACRCGLVGSPGDQHHPVDAEPLSSAGLPPVPAAALEIDTRKLGESGEDAA